VVSKPDDIDQSTVEKTISTAASRMIKEKLNYSPTATKSSLPPLQAESTTEPLPTESAAKGVSSDDVELHEIELTDTAPSQ
jgi:hypothetical protein